MSNVQDARKSLAHFGTANVDYHEGDPLAVVTVGETCLAFTVLDAPRAIGFHGETFVEYAYSFARKDR